jgi:pyruvate/2-oxoglutarate/acetoin dehydrogenase E1 component
MLYLESLNNSLHKILGENQDVIMMGEDLLDPYGGAFKVTKGLSTSYPDQVISTPISEAGIVGAAVGMAMRGLKPIVEIMFGDFIALAADQIINHATKYNGMYNGKVTVPMIIRTPVGGRRGYGPTHSQSLEALFMSVSGLDIFAPSVCHNPGEMLEELIKNIKRPTIFVEYKSDYAKHLHKDKVGDYYIIRNHNENQNLILTMYPDEMPDILIITYGGNVSIAIEGAQRAFMDEEIITNVLVVSSVRPIDEEWIINKVKQCGKIIIIEEGNKIGGWGAELSSSLNEKAYDLLDGPIKRLGAPDIPIPASGPMENEMLPSAEKILNTINSIMKI